MSTLVLSFSGTGEHSITLKSLEILEHHKDVDKFDKILVKTSFNYEKAFDNVLDAMQKADIIIWAVSPFHMNIQSHMLRFFEECRKRNVCLHNLNTFFITNVRVCDNFLQTTLEHQIRSISDFYVQGLSFAANDMINKKMALYTISSPDPPPKRGLFSKPPVFEEGEGLITAVQWYKNIKALALSKTESIDLDSKTSAKKVLFIDMDDEEAKQQRTSFVLTVVNQLKDFYKDNHCIVDDIAQRDFKVAPCDGCKICYASKECKMKDDYRDYENRLATADIIIYYGICAYGYTSSLSKKMIDRGVHNGLMPVNGRMPSEMDKFQAVGFVLDTDPVSYAQFKEYQFSLASFGFTHFLGVLAQLPFIGQNDLDTFEKYSMLITNERTLPQRNFWTEKVGKHFSDLSKNIPSVIPEEAKYYKRAGGYDEIPLDHNAKTIMADTAKIGAEMRLIPYEKTIEALDRKYGNNK